jgi:hypothetical protein
MMVGCYHISSFATGTCGKLEPLVSVDKLPFGSVFASPAFLKWDPNGL